VDQRDDVEAEFLEHAYHGSGYAGVADGMARTVLVQASDYGSPRLHNCRAGRRPPGRLREVDKLSGMPETVRELAIAEKHRRHVKTEMLLQHFRYVQNQELRPEVGGIVRDADNPPRLRTLDCLEFLRGPPAGRHPRYAIAKVPKPGHGDKMRP